MNQYRLIILGLLALTLVGCSVLPGSHSAQADSQRYTLSARESAAPVSSPHFPVVLGIASVSVPEWLNSPRMVYRLEYKTQGGLATYSESRWAAPPAAMVGQTLEDTLADSDIFKAVTDAGVSATDIVLQVSLTNFEQVFVSRQRSFGLVHARATLLQAGSDTVLAQREFHYRVPSPSADAAGGVQALGKASNQLTATISQWLQHTLTQCRPTCLRPEP